MDNNEIKIQSERLTLKYITPYYAPFIYALLNSQGWIKYIGDRNIKTWHDAEKYIIYKLQKDYIKNGFGLFLVQISETSVPIGLCGLIKREELHSIDLGYAFLSEYTKHGYAYEAANATLQYAKNNLNLHRVTAITMPKNNPSIALLKKLNFLFEKSIKLTDDIEELMLFSKKL